MRTATPRRRGLIVTLALALVGTMLPARDVQAASITICAAGCDHTSIQAAINAASPGDTLLLAGERFDETITVDRNLTIRGSDSLISIIDGGSSGTVVTVQPGVSLSLESLTVQNGRTAADGGGILNQGTLTATRVQVLSNVAATVASSRGGGIFSTGQLTLVDSTLTGNEAQAGGGAIYVSGPSASAVIEGTILAGNTVRDLTTDFRGGGAVHVAFGDAVVRDSQIISNTTDYTGGGVTVRGSGSEVQIIDTWIHGNTSTFGGGVRTQSSGVLSISGSTISGNVATSGGAAVGGGIRASSPLTVTNSTIVANAANAGAGFNSTGGGISAESTVSLDSVTVVDNSAAFGGGIASFSSGTTFITNSILAGNEAAVTANGHDCGGSLDGGTVLLIGDPTGCTVSAVTGVVIADPLLGPLLDNGGPTLTLLPQPGSPALDAGATSLTTDQRGFARPSGAAPDVGAVEVQVAAGDAPAIEPLADLTIDEGQRVEVTPVVSDPQDDPFTLSWSALPAGASATDGTFAWTPSEAQGPGAYEVTVTATQDDNPSLSDSETFTIDVQEVNEPPVLDPIADVTVAPGGTVATVVTAGDPDLPANALAFSIVSGPAGATLDPLTGLFSWTACSCPGLHVVEVSVTDGELSSSGSFDITVDAGAAGGHLFPPASAPSIGWQASWPSGALDVARRLGEIVVVASTGSMAPVRVAIVPEIPTPLDVDSDGMADALVTLSLAPGPGAYPEVTLSVARITFPGPQDVQIVAFVPLPEALSTETGKASLAVGFGTLAVGGGAGGLLPTSETITASIDELGGLVHRLGLRFETSGTPNPLVFYFGTGEGDGTEDGAAAASLFAIETSPVPSWIEFGLRTDMGLVTDPEPVASAGLDWLAPTDETEPTIVAFHLESEGVPRGGSADVDTRVRIEGIDPETSLLLTVEPDVALEATLRHNDPSNDGPNNIVADTIDRIQLEHTQGGLDLRAAIVEHRGQELVLRIDDGTGDINVESLFPFQLEFEVRRPGSGFFGDAFSHPVDWIYGAARDVRQMTIQGADRSGLTVSFPDARSDLVFVAADDPERLRYPVRQDGWPTDPPSQWSFDDWSQVVRVGLVDDAVGTTLAVISSQTPSLSIGLEPATLGQLVELNPVARTTLDVAAELGPRGLVERAVELGCRAFLHPGPLSFDLDPPNRFLLRSGGGDGLACYGETGTKSLTLGVDSLPANVSIDFDPAGGSAGSLAVEAQDVAGNPQSVLGATFILVDASGLTGAEPLGAPARILALSATALPSTDIRWSHGQAAGLALDVSVTTPEDRFEDLRFVLATRSDRFSEPFKPNVELPEGIDPTRFLASGELRLHLWELSDATILAAGLTAARGLSATVAPDGGAEVTVEIVESLPLGTDLVLPIGGHFLPAAGVIGSCRLEVPAGTSGLVTQLPGGAQVVTDSPDGFASLTCDQRVEVPAGALDVQAKLDAMGIPGDASLTLDLPARTIGITARGPIQNLTVDVRDHSTDGLPILSPFAHPIATLAFRADEVRSLAGAWSFSPGELEVELEATTRLDAVQFFASTSTMADSLTDAGVRHLVHIADQGDLLVADAETPGRGEIHISIRDLERIVVSHDEMLQMPLTIDLQTGQPRALDFDVFFDFDSPFAPLIPPGIPLQVTGEGRIADVSTATTIQTNGRDRHLVTGADGADLTAHLVLDDDGTDEGDDEDLALELFLDARGLPSSFGLNAFDFSPSQTPVQGGFLELSSTLPWLDLVLRDERRAGVLETGSTRIRIHLEQTPRRVSFLLEDRLDESQTGFFTVRGINDGRLGRLLIESDAASPNRPHLRSDFARITAELTDVPPTFDLLLNAREDELDAELTFRDGAVPAAGPDPDDRIGRVELLLEREAQAIDEDRGSPYEIYRDHSFTSLERSSFVRAVDDAYWPAGVRDRLAGAEAGFELATVLRRVGRGADGEGAVFRTVGTDDHLIVRLDEPGDTLTPDEVQLVAVAISNVHAVTITVDGPDSAASIVRPAGTGSPPLYLAIEELQRPRYEPAPASPKLAKPDKDAPPVQDDVRVHHIENGPLFEMTIDVLANDGDVDASTLSVTHQPDFAVAGVTEDGKIRYSPLLVSPANAFRVGWDRFIYRVCAPDGGCAEGRVDIVVRETFMGGVYARITELPDRLTMFTDGHVFLDPSSGVVILDRVGYSASSSPQGIDVYTGPRTMPPQSAPPALRLHASTAPTAITWQLTHPGSYLFRYKAVVTGPYDLAGVRATADGRTWFGAQGDGNFEVGGSATGLIGTVLQGERPAEEFRGCDRVLGIDTCVNLLGIAASGSASGSGISGFFSYAPATETTRRSREAGADEEEFLPLLTMRTRALQSLEGAAQLQFDPFKVPVFEVDGRWRARFDALALDVWARGAEGASILLGVGAFDVPLPASYETGIPFPVIRKPLGSFDPYDP